ncbi:hypothetical protein [Pseudoxanthomonas daejeonensis]|uniref:Outer membrane protein beta-barrel domain-containing protein n=1 Tax=Pseudoxanthomonas daejeonensis TaxID=266062 RepID=A0ABQ6ZBX6_9GAMM|nr:hypothetical protein [Pseudoxanthomonas daejeonensis]KAF1697533.1 hypothetical protein CSC65_01320 [Pseudoxanthomonas daejeonensis]
MPYASRRTKCMLLAAFSLLPGAASAVEPLDTFSVSIGGYVTRFDTRVRADGASFDGTPIDLSRDLGLDKDDTIGFLGVSWRPFGRHEVGLLYFQNGVESEKRLERDIVFEDHLYQASATVRGHYDVDAVEAYYTWWGFSEETWALGPRVGLTWYRIELGIELEADVNGRPVGSGGLEDAVSADLPAPTLGAAWRWTPAEDWRIVADAGWFSTEINGIDGDVTYVRTGLEWFPRDRIGVLLDYTLSNINARTDRDAFTGHLELRNSGLRLGAIYRF